MWGPLKQKTSAAVLGLGAAVLAVGLAGCSSSNPAPPPSDAVQFAEALVGAVLQDAVLPLINGIGIPIQKNLPAVLGSPALASCTPLGCDSGTGDLCQTGIDHYFANYAGCDAGGLLMNGSLLLSGNSTAAKWTTDLDINGSRMSGGATQTLSGSCTDTSLTDFQVSAPGFFGFTAGQYEYCGGRWVSGRITVDAEVYGAGDYVVVVKLDGTPEGTARVTTAAGAYVAGCATDLRAGSATCS